MSLRASRHCSHTILMTLRAPIHFSHTSQHVFTGTEIMLTRNPAFIYGHHDTVHTQSCMSLKASNTVHTQSCMSLQASIHCSHTILHVFTGIETLFTHNPACFTGIETLFTHNPACLYGHRDTFHTQASMSLQAPR